MRTFAEGFVLVGGLSSRMGRDKAFLPVDGKPLAILQAEKLATTCRGVSFVGKEPLPLPPGVASRFGFVKDSGAERAAIHGVEAALTAIIALSNGPSDADWALVLAVDLPAVRPEFLAALLERADLSGAAAAAPVVDGHVQGLCSAWRRDALPVVRARIAGGRLSVAGALEAAGALLLPEDEVAAMPGGDASNFLNLNTPEDHEAFHEARRRKEERRT
jgi:molybdopterin-guanine dinucleotide biosynthesis protein A